MPNLNMPDCVAPGCGFAADFVVMTYSIGRESGAPDVTWKPDPQSPFLCAEHVMEDTRFDGPHFSTARAGRTVTIYVPLPDEEE